MLQEVQVTAAPSGTSVAMSTAVSIGMWRQPATRAPVSGAVSLYSARSDIRPGISFSAMRIFLRPSSASVRSLILNAGNSVRVSMGSFLFADSELQSGLTRERVNDDGVKARGLEPRAELLRREAEPHVALLAQGFVIVGERVDDHDVAARPEQARRRGDRILRARRVHEHAGHHDEIGAADQLFGDIVDRALAEPDVR